MEDYTDQLIREGRNNVNHSGEYTRTMPCPNRWELGCKSTWADPKRYEEKKNRRHSVCPSGEAGMVHMRVKETGMWTSVECPLCGYKNFWAAGDGDALF